MSSSVLSTFSLSNKTAIVTGGTGGIGLHMTCALAEAGASIISIQLANDPNKHVLVDAIKALKRPISVFECNVGDSKSLRATFAQIWATGVVPDILLNCAGIVRRGKAEEMTDEDIDAVLAVNLKGTFVACQEFAKKLLQLQRPGKIVNIASIVGFVATVNCSAYATTKAGVINMTKAFSNEWASKGIQVNCIVPGYIRTPMIESAIEAPDGVFKNHALSRTPTNRFGKPEEFKGPVVFLASPASDFVTGTSLAVDGGLLGR